MIYGIPSLSIIRIVLCSGNYNKNKKERPWLITTNEAYVLMAVGGLIPREEHNEILEEVLPLLEKRNARKQDRIRVVFEGGFCEQPPLDMLRTIGRSCYVVDDDLLIGMRYILEDIEPGNDPLNAMAEAYINKSTYSPVQHDLRKTERKNAERTGPKCRCGSRDYYCC